MSNARIPILQHVGEPLTSGDKISIFDQNWFEQLLPDTMEIVSYGKRYTLQKCDNTISNSLIQFNYWHAADGDGDVLENGEPSSLEFDIHFLNNTDGMKLLVDVTYGNLMAYEFSIEAPNKINIINYNGIGSKYDSQTHFGLSDKSVSHLVDFFNSFNHGLSLTSKDLAFLDEHTDSYKHNIDNKDHLYTDDSKLMKWGNSMKETRRILDYKSFINK